MLHPETAKQKLKELADEKWKAKRVAAAARLPKHGRRIGLALLGHDENVKSIEDWEQLSAHQEAVVRTFAGLKDKDRHTLFETLFPKLGHHVEAAWQLHARLPYQTGYARKGFRAPSEPSIALAARKRWLEMLLEHTEEHIQDITWFAGWAPYLAGYGGDSLGILLAAAIELGGTIGDDVFDILCDSARGEHEIGGMGRHVSRALLISSRPDGWEFMEKMLLAAQRQEGLRQVILETIDEAHPEAFRRMVRLILEHDLGRFSSVVRALNVWFGFLWDSVSVSVVNETLQQILCFMEDEKARDKALAGDDGNALYLALWTLGFEDAVAAVKPAAALLKDRKLERRFVAAHFLGQLHIPAAHMVLAAAARDEDLRVALTAYEGLGTVSSYEYLNDDKPAPDIFEQTEYFLGRLPLKPVKLEPLVWPWSTLSADVRRVAINLLPCLGDRPPTRLLPYLKWMSSYGKAGVAELLGQQKKWDRPTRETLFSLIGDSAAHVREKALEILRNCEVTASEAEELESHLTRKPADLRRAVIVLLLTQKDDAVLASADRLLSTANPLQRLGGLELLRQLAEARRACDACRERAEVYRNNRPRLTGDEEKQLVAISDTGRKIYTLEDALGLMNPAELTRPIPPRNKNIAFVTPAALACLQSLDELIHEQRETPIAIETWEGSKQELLGNLRWGFPSPNYDKPPAEDIERFPLRELFEKWRDERPSKLRDTDGLELLRASVRLGFNEEHQSWATRLRGKKNASALALLGDKLSKPLRYQAIIGDVLQWLLRIHQYERAIDFALDAAETAFALIPPNELSKLPSGEDSSDGPAWRNHDSPFLAWIREAGACRRCWPEQWADRHTVRLWYLLHWQDQPAPDVPRDRPDFTRVLAAQQLGAASEADLFEHLLGPRAERRYCNEAFDSLSAITARKLTEELRPAETVADLANRCRQRILEIELQRGESPTAASAPANALSSLSGVDVLIQLLHSLGKASFTRGWSSYERGLSKPAVLSHLIEVTYPADSDTPDSFAARLTEAGIELQRLIELAFHAPQWVKFVERALGWENFAEAVWWFMAHVRYGDPGEDRESWAKLVSERTPLTAEELAEGAVDVAWFHRVYAAVGAKRWENLRDASKYACSGQGHKQALLLSDVLLGKARRNDLIANIHKKQRRESVRLLGLLPLANGKGREHDIQQRYKVLQGYLAYARKLSAMTKDSALRAQAIGMANLARTAGYPDPLRFEWAMEAEAISDLARGPVQVSVAGVQVALAIDDEGQPDLSVSKDGRPLKAIPTPVKKHGKVAELVSRKTELRKQVGRIRLSLEQSMCRGDTFTAGELRQLCAHAILRPQLERLVLIGEGIIGYPVAGGKALRNHGGKLEPLKKNENVRIAHPHDLLLTRNWQGWQHDCFAAERVQPFKQIFRELYVVTEQERADGTISRRYAGQQVNPRQATSLWGSRGWTVNENEGVRRTFYEANLSAWVTFLAGTFTPAEVEGWTLEGVRFSKRGEWEPLALADIPPRLFSEVMRDLDLVVSVAHKGGVDPEASAPTVEMRAALLSETCALLKLDNVRIKDTRAFIDGQLAQYNVHLGSAVVHRQPGGHLCIVPVHAEHRGRLFLPFAADDPKTAEVLSKVILLARDSEIQDPNILDQIRA